MENSDVVYNKIKKNKKTLYPLLFLILKVYKMLLIMNVDCICVFATASETFSKKILI